LHRNLPARVTGSWDPADLRRLERILRYANYASSADVATLLPPDASAAAAAAVREYCSFAHCGILLFPDTLDLALRYFTECGFDPLPPVPSVLVRRRLSERYDLTTEACEVVITRLRTFPGRRAHYPLEVFLFPRTARALEPRIVHSERSSGFENHIAFQVSQPDDQLLERLMALLQDDAGMVWEGGGHNPYEGTNGTTVLYFVRNRSATPRLIERWELHCRGDFSSVVDRHPVDAAAVARTYAAWADATAPVRRRRIVSWLAGLHSTRPSFGTYRPRRRKT
jgi:hypothetical protein